MSPRFLSWAGIVLALLNMALIAVLFWRSRRRVRAPRLDAKVLAPLVWPHIEQCVDRELALSLSQIGVPGSGASAVGGRA